MMQNPVLDGLRALAILFVFVGHVFPSYLSTAWVGVEIFFILSGYLITGTILHHNDYIYFYKRRALRILPALLYFLIVFLIVGYFFQIPYSKEYILSSVFFYSNWLLAFNIEPINYLAHLWSLAVEEQFYLIFPWLLFIFVRYPKSLVLTFVLCFCYKFHMFQVEWSFDRIYYATDTRLASFLLGAILFFMHSGKFDFNMQVNPMYTNCLSSFALFLLLIISLLAINENNIYWAFLSNIWVAILIYFSHDCNVIVNRILSSKILCWIGKLSFGLYLWHYPIVTYLNAYYSWYIVLFFGIPFCFLCAYVSYNYIEQPLLHRGKRTNLVSLKRF